MNCPDPGPPIPLGNCTVTQPDGTETPEVVGGWVVPDNLTPEEFNTWFDSLLELAQ